MMSPHRGRGAWLIAGGIVFSATLAPPALANHIVDPAITQGPQTPPIKLGTSGSSQTLLLVKALLYCYAGTLGGLVEDVNGVQYVLSNNHVLAKENENLQYGTDAANRTIIQPGLLDEGPCTLNSGESSVGVADLSDYVDILFGKGKNKPANVVDAAIAQARAGQVDPAGTILGIGTVGGPIAVDGVLNEAVQKTGRTTLHTFGTVMAVDVTLDVSYESGTARFLHQLRIRRPCGDAGFSGSGDSGSLIVTAPGAGEEPRAVGLLFAGGGSDTFANPIGPVLEALGVSMVTAPDGVDNEGAMLSDHAAIVAVCPTGGGGHGRPRGAPPGLTVAKEVAARRSGQIFALPDVVGHGIGADEAGDAVIEIYVTKERRGAGRSYPAAIEGVPVRVIETGPIRAY